MHGRCEYDKLVNEMCTIFIESHLASPLVNSGTVEGSPKDTVRKLVNNFLYSFEKDEIVSSLAVFDEQYHKLDWDGMVESQGIKEGSKLYLVYDDASFFRPDHILTVGIITIIVAFTFFIVSSYLLGASGGDIPFDYGIVVDAGSTHSEVFLYQWFGSKFHGTGEVFQKDSCRIEVGIADGHDPADLVSCVNNITVALPTSITSSVPLYLGATGGMRLLNMSSPLDAQLIITAIKYAFKTTSVQEGSVGIIQGLHEALFSWITVNFLNQTLKQDKVNATYGALDLGGASTQIGVALDSDSDTNRSDVKVIKLYGNKYSVMTRSFLCFGLSEASDRNEAIIFMKNKNKTIIDPCLPRGYSLILKTKKFLEKPCIKSDDVKKYLQNTTEKEIKVDGSSNYEKCLEVVKNLTNSTMCKSMGFEQCLDTIDIAQQNRKYLAFSSFYYIVQYLNSSGSLEDFFKATKSFCSLSYDQMKHKARDASELSHLLKYCFGAVYVGELLTKNYGFNHTTWENIQFLQSIKGADIGWSLGFMINATNAIPEEAPRPPVITLKIYIPILLISVLMVFFALIVLKMNVKLCKKEKREFLLESIP